MPEFVLVKAGSFKLYTKRGAAPSFHKDLSTVDGAGRTVVMSKKGGNFSLHHIIPYRYMAFLGFIFDKFRDVPALRNPDVRTKEGAILIGTKWDVINTMNALVPNQKTYDPFSGGSDPAFVNLFAWCGCNLFTGPGGNFRLDDPAHEDGGDDTEPTRPASFDTSRWGALKALFTFINLHARFERTGGDHMTVTLTHDLTYQNFVNHLFTRLLAIPSVKDAHPFTTDDWYVVDSEEKEWSEQMSRLAHGHSSLVECREHITRLAKAGKADLYTCVAHQDVSFKGTGQVGKFMKGSTYYYDLPSGSEFAAQNWIAFWRLRLDGEPKSSLKYKANFRLQ